MKRIFESIKSKMMFVLFLAMTFIYISGSSFLIVENREIMLKNLEKQGTQMAELMAKTSLSYMKRFFYIKILEDAVKVEEFPEVAYCEVYDENKKSVTKITYVNKGQNIYKREVIRNKEIMVVSSVIEDGGEIYGYVEIGLYKKHIKKAVWARVILLLSIFFILMFLSGIGMNIFISKIFLNPVLEISDVMTKLSKGEFALSSLEKREDEIGELARNFNNMSNHLKENFDKIDSENKNLLKAFNFKKHILEISEEKVMERTKELKKALEQMEFAKQQVEKANKDAMEANRAKTEFIANISHEIRTPLNVIIGFSDLLESLAEDNTQKKYLESIKSSSKGLLALINDILDLSKLEVEKMELQYEDVELRKLFSELESIFKYRLQEKGVEFEKKISRNIPDTISFDELRLRQILFNIIGNAVKFTEDGYVKLDVRFNYKNEKKGDLIIEIEDTGIGIADGDKEKIFKSFRQQQGQNTRKYGGTGLGLAISKKLVEIMSGEIGLESKLGKGSKFILTFKDVSISNANIEKTDKSKIKYDNIVFEASTVLVVDDIEMNRNIIIANLAKTNLNLIEAKDGKEALQLVKEYIPDLVLLDVRMPEVSGYDVMEKLQEDFYLKEIPVIAITADEAKAKLEESFEDYIIKPFRRNELFDLIMKYIPYFEKEDNKEELFLDQKIEREAFPTLKELIIILEGDYMKQWESFIETQPVNEVRTFASDLLNLGKDYRLSMLENYGKNLLESVENFDVESIRNTLKRYKALLQRLKKAL